MTAKSVARAGFTLVEMLIVAPVVILFIGGVIYLLVNLTGDTIASRNEDALAYDLQRAITQIETDVKTSERFLAATDIVLTDTGQGYGDTPAAGSPTPFTNVNTSGGSPASLVLRSYATTGIPGAPTTRVVFFANTPHDCSLPEMYMLNTPLSINIVYFTDTDGTLWRRTILPHGYDSPSTLCGNAPWQLPSCVVGYNSSRTFCKTNDEKIAEGATIHFSYYAQASDASPNTSASNPGLSESARNTALESTPTVHVELTTSKTVAGRDISRTSSTFATRLSSL